VRSAIGATQGRILRQLLIEGLVLCTIASATGVAFGWMGLRALLSIRPDYLARIPDVGLNWPVLLFRGCDILGRGAALWTGAKYCVGEGRFDSYLARSRAHFTGANTSRLTIHAHRGRSDARICPDDRGRSHDSYASETSRSPAWI